MLILKKKDTFLVNVKLKNEFLHVSIVQIYLFVKQEDYISYGFCEFLFDKLIDRMEKYFYKTAVANIKSMDLESHLSFFPFIGT